MSEHVKKFIDDLSNGKNADAGEAFKDALRAKVADGLDKQRVDVASKILMLPSPSTSFDTLAAISLQVARTGNPSSPGLPAILFHKPVV